MKKKFKKSYRLGITAGLVSGIIMMFIFAPFLPLYHEAMPTLFSLKTLFLMFLAFGGIPSMMIGIIFITFINVLPTSNIVAKIFVFNMIFTLLSLPSRLLTGSPIPISPYWEAAMYLVDIIFYPLVYSGAYIFIAKKMPGVIKMNRLAFVFAIGIALFVLFVPFMVSGGLDVYKVATEPKVQTQIDPLQIERDIFGMVNQKRAELGNEPLVWSNDLHEIARNYSVQFAKTNAFSHIGDDGKTLSDRLKTQGLFYFVASENLYMESNKNKGDFAKSTFDGWMNSPAHRSTIVDKDKFYSHAGVGVACNELYCYSVMDFAAFEEEGRYKIDSDEYYFIGLNNEGLGFEGAYLVYIQIKASNPVDVYFFDNLNQLRAFADLGEDESSYKEINVKKFVSQHEAKQGSHIAIFPHNEVPTNIWHRLTYNYPKK